MTFRARSFLIGHFFLWRAGHAHYRVHAFYAFGLKRYPIRRGVDGTHAKKAYIGQQSLRGSLPVSVPHASTSDETPFSLRFEGVYLAYSILNQETKPTKTARPLIACLLCRPVMAAVRGKEARREESRNGFRPPEVERHRPMVVKLVPGILFVWHDVFVG